MKELSLKVNWFDSYLKFDEIKILADYSLNNRIGVCIWHTNMTEEDIIELYKDCFWRDVLIAWSKLTYYNLKNITQIKQQPIWGNSLLRQDNKPIFNYKAIQKGLFYFGQLLQEDNY